MRNRFSVRCLRCLFSAAGAVIFAVAAQIASAQQSPGGAQPATRPILSLHDASAAGDLARVKELVEKGADVNAPSAAEREAPLLAALKGNQPEVAAYLIDHGADVKTEGVGGDTALTHAAYWGTTDLVKRILDMGADRMKTNSVGRTPLHYAVERNHLDAVRLLTPGPAGINAPDSRGNAPIDLAITNASEEMVLTLLNAGAKFSVEPDRTMERVDICVQKRWFATIDRALEQAANAPIYKRKLIDRAYNTAFALGDVEFLKHLAELGANLNAPTATGDPRLFVAADLNRVGVVDILLEQGGDAKQMLPHSKWTALHAAAAHAGSEVVQRLLEKGADPNALDSLGRSPLHVAAYSGNAAAVSALIAAGADATRVDVLGDSALHYAAPTGSMAVVRALLRAHAPQAPNQVGLTPYDLAGEAEHYDVQAILSSGGPVPPGYDELIPLLAAGPSADEIAVARERWMSPATHGTPLIHIAVSAGSLKAVQQLLNKDKTAISARDVSGILPVHLAAELRDTAILTELLARGASINDQSNDAKWTPLHFAASAGNVGAVKLLLAKGANPKLLDARGQSPKAIAQSLKRPVVMATLP